MGAQTMVERTEPLTLWQLRFDGERFFVCRADDDTPGDVWAEARAETFGEAKEFWLAVPGPGKQAVRGVRRLAGHKAPAFRSRAERRAGLQAKGAK